MPEYLAPGVYVEEVSFRSKSIAGVPTSTTGYAGMTRYGPVQFVDNGRRGPRSTEPRLITSFTEFEQVFGGLERLRLDRGDGQPRSESYVAHAARAFFLNGGKRLYVSRVFAPIDPGGGAALDWGIARLPLPF
ncbi:MAG: phage tail sheath family protein, partial [Acidimicrobiia bacterium]|nr:phage tail sheath family protein [Acidimicrobiia bacterium]